MTQGLFRGWGSGGWIVLGLSVASSGVAVLFVGQGSRVYEFVFGGLDPVAVTLGACLVGSASLGVLHRRGGFRVWAEDETGYREVVALGMALTLPVIAVDVLGGFPADLNVAFPASLLFYPAIAVVAEFLLHVFPLALICVILPACADGESRRTRWAVFFVVACLEPALQIGWGAERSPSWANAYVGVHLLVFNLIALIIFERRGFFSMYLFRLGYYAIWHLLWGGLRLGILWR